MLRIPTKHCFVVAVTEQLQSWKFIFDYVREINHWNYHSNLLFQCLHSLVRLGFQLPLPSVLFSRVGILLVIELNTLIAKRLP